MIQKTDLIQRMLVCIWWFLCIQNRCMHADYKQQSSVSVFSVYCILMVVHVDVQVVIEAHVSSPTRDNSKGSRRQMLHLEETSREQQLNNIISVQMMMLYMFNYCVLGELGTLNLEGHCCHTQGYEFPFLLFFSSQLVCIIQYS